MSKVCILALKKEESELIPAAFGSTGSMTMTKHKGHFEGIPTGDNRDLKKKRVGTKCSFSQNSDSFTRHFFCNASDIRQGEKRLTFCFKTA
jgi:hypothetical protein